MPLPGWVRCSGSAMMPRSVVPAMARSAFAAIAFSMPLGPTPLGFFFFFGFDFFAEFFFFGVSATAFFAFVVAFFDRARFSFAVVRFGFVLAGGGEQGRRGGGGQAGGVCGSGRRKQHQRGEEEDQQDRELAHGPCIGAVRSPP